ncbi:hypothetical protein Tco_0200158, partial [Tanacetum coccineum]
MDSIILIGKKNTLVEYMILSGADNRPPMLDKDLYDSWKTRMELYMQNRENGRMKKMGKFVTSVKLVKDLHTTNFDQLHAYLQQHELHTKEVCIMRERNRDPLALVANHQQTPSHFNTYQSLYNNLQFQQEFSPFQSPQYGLIHPTQHYSSTHPSTPLAISYPSTPYSNVYASSVYQDAYPQPQSVPQIEYICLKKTRYAMSGKVDMAYWAEFFGAEGIRRIGNWSNAFSCEVLAWIRRTDNQEKDEKQSQNDKTGLGMEKTVKDKAKSKPKSQSGQSQSQPKSTPRPKKKEEEERIAEEQAAKDRSGKIPICYDDDEDDTIAITPVLPIEEPDNSLSIGDEHLDTIPATELDEVIKSTTPLNTLNEHSEIVVNSDDDNSSSDDDSPYGENIDYVDASPPDVEIVSLEVVEFVDREVI